MHDSSTSSIAPDEMLCSSPSCESRCKLPLLDTRSEAGVTSSTPWTFAESRVKRNIAVHERGGNL